MKIKQAVEEFVSTYEAANKDLSGLPSSVRPGWEASKKDAERELAAKRLQLTISIEKHAVFIHLEGDSQALTDFCALARKRAGVVVVSRNLLYDDMAERVWPSIGPSKQFGPSHFNFMVQIFRSLTLDLGLTVASVPRFTETTVVNDVFELSTFIRTLLDPSVEEVLAAKTFLKQVTEQVAHTKMPLDNLWVLVYGEPDLLGLFEAKKTKLTLQSPITETHFNEAFSKMESLSGSQILTKEKTSSEVKPLIDSKKKTHKKEEN